jgi:hypothetical protein
MSKHNRFTNHIETRFLGPTNYRGSRVKAWSGEHSIVVPWDHALNAGENHERAASALALKLGWEGDWILFGSTDKGDLFGRIRPIAFTIGGATK